MERNGTKRNDGVVSNGSDSRRSDFGRDFDMPFLSISLLRTIGLARVTRIVSKPHSVQLMWATCTRFPNFYFKRQRLITWCSEIWEWDSLYRRLTMYLMGLRHVSHLAILCSKTSAFEDWCEWYDTADGERRLDEVNGVLIALSSRIFVKSKPSIFTYSSPASRFQIRPWIRRRPIWRRSPFNEPTQYVNLSIPKSGCG